MRIRAKGVKKMEQAKLDEIKQQMLSIYNVQLQGLYKFYSNDLNPTHIRLLYLKTIQEHILNRIEDEVVGLEKKSEQLKQIKEVLKKKEE